MACNNFCLFEERKNIDKLHRLSVVVQTSKIKPFAILSQQVSRLRSVCIAVEFNPAFFCCLLKLKSQEWFNNGFKKKIALHKQETFAQRNA